MHNKKYEIDMCSGSILKKMLLFSLPLMLSGILQLLFNAADIIVVGKYAGDNSLAAVGATSSLINLLTNVFIGLSVGSNVLTARFYGANQQKELKETVHTSIMLSLVSGAILAVIGFIGAPIIMSKMNTPPKVLKLASLYLRIYFLGMPATMVYNFGSAVLRAVGDTRRPLYYLAFAGVINVGLNLIFVIVLHMDVAGVALATVISQFISAFLVLRCLIKEEGGIHLELKELHIKADKFWKIVQIGLPAGFQGTLFSLSNVFIQSSVNLFGETVIAGNSSASSVEGFVYVAMNSLYQAAISFTSQNIGAMKFERVNKILFTAQGLVIATGVIMGNLVVLCGRPLLSLYTDSPAVVEAGMVRLMYICSVYALCGMMDVMVGSMRGMGCSIVPMIVSLLGACAFRLVWLATIFQIPEYHCIETIYMSYPVSWTLTFLAHVICFIIVRYKRGKEWKVMQQGV
ncbi:MAG: MATE family efflux transporter [Lachnospiraceae bacterium]|nr:MATE family efflux transporter [Lachnospiraceae bacterium]